MIMDLIGANEVLREKQELRIKVWIRGNTWKVGFFVWLLLLAVMLSGCVSTGDIEGIVDKAGKGIATVQVANASKALADTRKIKAQTKKDNDKSMAAMTSKLPAEVQATLIYQKINADVESAKNTWVKGFMMGIMFLMIIIYLSKVVRFFWKRPKEENTKY